MQQLSIITICRNEAKRIEATLLSVFNQTFKDFQFIVIDGASTDGTIKIIERHKARIAIFVSEPDKGIYNAMNKAIDYCKGNYIYFLNAGDILYSNKTLEKIFSYNIHADLIYGNIHVFNSSGFSKTLEMPPLLTKEFLLHKTIPHQATFTKKKLFDRIGKYNENYKIAADYKFSLQAIFQQKCSVQYIPEIFANFDNTGIGTVQKKIREKEKKNIQIEIFKNNKQMHLKLKNKLNTFFTSKITKQELINPVFIIGTGRCGTTLLTKILNSHPKIYMYPTEANELWHPLLYPIEKAQINIKPIEANPSEFTKISIKNWPKNQPEIIKQTFQKEFLRHKNQVFIVKSAMISFMLSEILTIYPEARFIHIFRYGPSVVESYVKKNQGRYQNWKPTKQEYYNYCANYWNETILSIEQQKNILLKNKPHQFLEFSYEKLCDNKIDTIKKIASFLHIPFDEFSFDFKTIKSTNYKVNIAKDEPLWENPLKIMQKGLMQKKY